jgi:hypothetical protein
MKHVIVYDLNDKSPDDKRHLMLNFHASDMQLALSDILQKIRTILKYPDEDDMIHEEAYENIRDIIIGILDDYDLLKVIE